MKRRSFLYTLCLSACPAPWLHARNTSMPLPSNSLYQLPVILQDHTGRRLPLQDMRGPVRIVTMFYTTCGYACPLTIDTLKAIQEKLSAHEQNRLQLLLISLDPERDSVPVLKRTMEQRQLDPRTWTMARVDATDVRRLAATLGVQYRQLTDMEINHSSILTLLDGQGRIKAKTSTIGHIDPVFLAAVRSVLAEQDKPAQQSPQGAS
jgi:protein SCO1